MNREIVFLKARLERDSPWQAIAWLTVFQIGLWLTFIFHLFLKTRY